MENKNSFGLAAADYRDFRPRYPASLFAHLANLSGATEAALDCATGNGQAAVGLARHFTRVAAFDSSRAQIAAAIDDPRVEYRVGTAEALSYTNREFDLVTVAQGAHWFDLPRFYAELERVVKPGAVVAIWGYSYCVIEPTIDRLVAAHLLEPIEPYWDQGRRVIVEKYATIEFPFAELPWPRLVATHAWTRGAYLGYLRTWSAYKRYVAAAGVDPLPELEAVLEPVWPSDSAKPVQFELVGRVGRVTRG
jgi:ubiquinone/menaquinone biosynthesis C-methylase UbiE